MSAQLPPESVNDDCTCPETEGPCLRHPSCIGRMPLARKSMVRFLQRLSGLKTAQELLDERERGGDSL